MGCGQSKINFYPRRNKHGGGKANGAKKTGTGEKDSDDEEGAAGAGPADAGADDDVTAEDVDKGKHLLPLVPHAAAATVEVSASQQDFFKMLDEKIEKGRDYDPSSECEIRAERERRARLLRDWQSKSQSSPPAHARRRPPPPRRAASVQLAAAPPAPPPPRRSPVPPSRDTDGPASPARRPHGAGVGWKPSPKVSPYCQRVTRNGVSEADETPPGHDSQITYNPTFQTHSPAHAPLAAAGSAPAQPYVAQVVTHPPVGPAPPDGYISPETYHEPPDPAQHASLPRQPPAAQPNVYYMHGNVVAPAPERTLTQKQQTALHLQHYVAMKQAQQNMLGYLQRLPGEEGSGGAYCAGHREPPRPRSAPPAGNPLLAMSPLVGQVAMFSSATPVLPPHCHFPPSVYAPTEVQYYQQAQLVQSVYRAGSAGTLTRYQARDKMAAVAAGAGGGGAKSNECQSINLVRQKAVGQIVSLGGQDLGVYQDSSECAGAQPPLPGVVGTLECSAARAPLEQSKNSNGGAVKCRTQKLKSRSKSVDSKKD